MLSNKIYKVIKIVISSLVLIGVMLDISGFSPVLFGFSYYTYSFSLLASIFCIINVFWRKTDRYYIYVVPQACLIIPVVLLLLMDMSSIFMIIVHFLYPFMIIVDYFILSVRIGNRKERSYTYKQMFYVLVFPLTYLGYAITIGLIYNMYPYTFVNYTTLRSVGLFILAVIFIITFISLTFITLTLNNYLYKKNNDHYVGGRLINRLPNYTTSIMLILSSITLLVSFVFTAGLIPDRESYYYENYPHYIGMVEDGYLFTSLNDDSCILLDITGSVSEYDYDCSGDEYSNNYSFTYTNDDKTTYLIRDIISRIEYSLDIEEYIDFSEYYTEEELSIELDDTIYNVNDTFIYTNFNIEDNIIYLRYVRSFAESYYDEEAGYTVINIQQEYLHIKMDLTTNDLIYIFLSNNNQEPIEFDYYYKVNSIYNNEEIEYFDKETFDLIEPDNIILDSKDLTIPGEFDNYTYYYANDDYYIGYYTYMHDDRLNVYSFVKYDYESSYEYAEIEFYDYMYYTSPYFSERIYPFTYRNIDYIYNNNLYLFEHFWDEITIDVYDNEFNVTTKTYNFHNNFTYLTEDGKFIFIGLYRDVYSYKYCEYSIFTILDVYTDEIITSDRVVYYSA